MGMRQVVGPSGSGLTCTLTQLYESTPQAAFLTADPRANLSFLRETVIEELAFGLEQRAVPVPEMRRRIMWVAEALNLTDLLECDPARLSGGQTRRVGIAKVLILGAPLVLLDDPFSGLDSASREDLRLLLHSMSTDTDTDTDIVLAGHRAWMENIPTEFLGTVGDPVPTPARVSPVRTGVIELGPVWGRRGGGSRRWWQWREPVDGVFSVGPVDVRVERGAVLWLRGPNGAGKSTVMRAIAGLDGAVRPTAPTGLLLQDPGDQVIDSTVGEQVPSSYWRERFGLDGQRHPLDLCQRDLRLAQFAGELARAPELLLADEPDVGLDATGRGLFHSGLAEFLDGGGAVMQSCHDESFVTEVAQYAEVRELVLPAH